MEDSDYTITNRHMEKNHDSVTLSGTVKGGEYDIDVDFDTILLKVPGECEPPDEYEPYPIFLQKKCFVVEIVVRDSNTKKCKVVEIDLEPEFIEGCAKQIEDDFDWHQE